MVDVGRLDPAPLGFGRCARCPYLAVGSAAICSACAARTMEPLPEPRCPICEQDLQGRSRCGNTLCHDPSRSLDAVRAVSVKTGALEQAIHAYKYDGKYGWATIFGRVLVGYLDEHAPLYDKIDLITPMPTFLGPGSRRSWSHTGLMVEKAAVEAGGRFPFDLEDPQLIVKRAETHQLVGLNAAERQRVVGEDLREALHVPMPVRAEGQRIVVVDDVFTRGSTMNEVARALKAAGAAEVTGLVLARTPWGS